MTTAIAIKRKALAEALKHVGPVASKSLGEHVRLVVKGGVLTLLSRAHDMSANAVIPLDGEDKDAWLAVHYPWLSRFVAHTKGEDIVLDFGETLRVSCGTSTVEFLSLGHWAVSVGEVPKFDSVGGKELAEAVKFASVGMAKEKVRYNMRGLWFQNHKSGLSVWGACGPFMHRALVPGMSAGVDGTVPYDAVEVMKAAGEGLGIALNDREWVMTVDDTVLWGPLLGEAFPNVQGVVSNLAEIGTVATIHRTALLEAVTVAVIGISDNEKMLVTLEAKASGLWVSGTERSSAVKVAGQHLIECQIETPLRIILDGENLFKSISAFPVGPIEIMLGKISNGELLRLSTSHREAYLMGVMG